MTIVSSPALHRTSKFLVSTKSSQVQAETEEECRPYFVNLSTLPKGQLEDLRKTGLIFRDEEEDKDSLDVCLLTERHIRYLEQTWNQDNERNLRTSFVSLDASRPWMLYWTLHACDLMNHTPSPVHCRKILNTIKACWTPAENAAGGGGFGGGPTQMPHAATTYSAVLVLCILATHNNNTEPTIEETEESQQSLDSSYATDALQYLRDIREPLFQWMLSLRGPKKAGGVAIRMHHDGEMDVRASYCVMVVAKLLGMARPSLTNGLADYLISCQTYEGGFGGEPGAEAHGGYAFCASAALFLLNELKHDSKRDQVSLDLPALAQWLAQRQMSYEGGFSGRSNKLVDGCYSFWQGGAVAIVSVAIQGTTTVPGYDPWLNATAADTTISLPPLLMDEGMLERYILLCAQDLTGGLRDKPSKRRDFYHSCYNLSGLSVAQHCGAISFGHPQQTQVAPTHPCYNLRMDRVRAILKHFEDAS